MEAAAVTIVVREFDKKSLPFYRSEKCSIQQSFEWRNRTAFILKVDWLYFLIAYFLRGAHECERVRNPIGFELFEFKLLDTLHSCKCRLWLMEFYFF